MKQKLCGLLCLLCFLFLCGCDLELATPEGLISAPKSNQEKMQQKQMITAFLGREESLIVPEDAANSDAYRFVDLDGDNEEEIIAFYANKENNFMLGFLILDQADGQWFLRNKAVAYGTDIHYFDIQDLDDDGQMEVLLGVRTGYGSLKELYLYQVQENELNDISNGDRITYDQIVLAKNAAGRNVLVTARTDTSVLEGSSDIMVYNYGGGYLYPVYDATFGGYCSEIRYDRISPTQDGVYLAMRHNHFINILLLKETDEGFAVLMEHPMAYDYEDMQSWELFRDENDDGILEICSIWQPELTASEGNYTDFVQVWLQWDESEGLRAVDAILDRYGEGYRFQLPLEWIDYLYYDFRNEDAVSWIDFYSDNEAMEFETVFSLASVDQLVWDTMDRNDLVVLGNNPAKNKIYIAKINRQEFHGFPVDASQLISCLQVEGGERK